MARYILDTNVFNLLLLDSTNCLYLDGLELIGTYVQKMEIENTTQEPKRYRLLELFAAFTPGTELPYTTLWGDPWGARWSGSDGLYGQVLSEVRKSNRAYKKTKKRENQERDAQIAEVAIKSNLTLVSNDQGLREVVLAFGGYAVSMAELEIHGPVGP